MATIALYQGKINQMPGLIKAAKKSVETFKSELSSLQKKANKVDSSVCDLSEVINAIQASAQTQENRIEALENFQTNSEDFINDVVRIDGKVADTVNENKEDFYDKYDYLKPDCEKSGWEKFCDACKALGEWCKEHWKVIAAALIIIALGVASILTGGALAAILSAAFIGALKGAAIGAILGGLQSIVNGESFWDGFENGLFSGALMGGIFGGLGKAAELLGSSCKFLMNSGAGQFLARHSKDLFKIAKISGKISLSMFGFDMVSLGAGLVFGKDNWLTSFNRTLHQSKVYNLFQLSAGVVATISGGLIKGMRNPSCFVAGTMVLTATGLVAIENIKAGDRVVSANTDTGECAEKTVLETYVRQVTEVVYLTIGGEKITTTHDHPFYVAGKGFVNAGKLQIKDILLNSNQNRLTIDDISFDSSETATTVYNIKVDDFHTYYVGANSVLVHNADYSPEKMQRIKERQQAGHDFEQEKHEALKQKNPTAEAQVRVKPIDQNGNAMAKGGNYLDDLYFNEETGQFEINEYKLGPDSPYQKNQIANGFPDGATNKDMMITSGANKGKILPAGTPVHTIRSEP